MYIYQGAGILGHSQNAAFFRKVSLLIVIKSCSYHYHILIIFIFVSIMVVCFIIIYFFELMVVESAKVKGDCVIRVGNKGNY